MEMNEQKKKKTETRSHARILRYRKNNNTQFASTQYLQLYQTYAHALLTNTPLAVAATTITKMWRKRNVCISSEKRKKMYGLVVFVLI